ncbi:DUF3341 domain-containing protein [Mangrovibrevibacter kandeliae]|uniref:DUF3341 domain-containing protein n=1 Tax=Mangrovibrevibacter kandeliae TaxID=2968473 RepID=UPI002117BCE1|nr:DUF3341 domain-containing protein [Aurantimonas sp. MSK8Z-1]MCQ8783995.1 DUF3341 domain-containing protein [Aurantimonas sp. CSK15Z-1]MCW4116712.1 DUF3341 domain-containing protein [Aurantimonas sp. MSK8Z-1]
MSILLLAEFRDPQTLLAAARQTREATSFRVVDAFTPFSVEGMGALIDELPPNHVRLAILLGGIGGALSGLGLQLYSAVWALPIVTGGRPLASWPDFFFATFEMGILGAALCGFVALLWGCGLPRLHHPLFDLPQFERATQDRFFLAIEAGGADADDADDGGARLHLAGLGALSVARVPA